MSDRQTLDRLDDGAWLLRTTQTLPVARATIFPFFAAAENLARLTPPRMRFEILLPTPIRMDAGTVIDYRIRVFRLPVRWRTLITRWNPPHEFVDVQLRGPYKEWIHSHRFTETASGTTVMEDQVRFRLPFGRLGAIGMPLVRRELTRIFAYRREVIAQLFAAGPAPSATLPPIRTGEPPPAA
jgi:ligand-binding SRPBCC domain-containing protein